VVRKRFLLKVTKKKVKGRTRTGDRACKTGRGAEPMWVEAGKGGKYGGVVEPWTLRFKRDVVPRVTLENPNQEKEN